MTPPAPHPSLMTRLRRGDTLLGCFLSLGSPLTAEIMGYAGYDWALIDLEHGAGGESDVLPQLHALSGTGAAAVVRVESHVRQRVHRVLDFGAHGVMFPRIESPEEAAAAVAAMRYPPAGVRGVAFSNRAALYGSEFRSYLQRSATELVTVIQIESPRAVENVDAIAALDGVDVLFVGPTDLSHSLGMLGEFERPEFQQVIERVTAVARRHKKALGILLPTPQDFGRYYALGFRFIASGSDAVLLNNAARGLAGTLQQFKRQAHGDGPC